MKFEKPIINISMFEMENVVTSSGDVPVKKLTADEYAKSMNDVQSIIEITF